MRSSPRRISPGTSATGAWPFCSAPAQQHSWPPSSPSRSSASSPTASSRSRRSRRRHAVHRLRELRRSVRLGGVPDACMRTIIYTLIVVIVGAHRSASRSRSSSAPSGVGRSVFRTIFMYPLHDRPHRSGPAMAVPAHRRLRHRQRAALPYGILQSPDQIHWLSDPNIALFSVALAGCLVAHVVHHARVLRGPAEHPVRRDRGRPHRRRELPAAPLQHDHPIAAARNRRRPDRTRHRRRRGLRHHPHPTNCGRRDHDPLRPASSTAR